MNLEELFAAIRRRQALGEGIGLALPYLAGIAPCLGDNACQVQVFKMGAPEEWQRAVKEAANRLVYRDADMVAEGGIWVANGGASREWGEKKPKEPSPGACMDFEGIITSRKKDRDGDILESEGAEPDERMPLLWQHIPMMPVGKLITIINRSKNRVSGHFSIMDSELGRDSAQLVEFGALRLSHGFLPLEFEQLERDENTPEHRFPGWHVLRFKILETSLVSVPSNEDAVITAFSRGKLFHPLVKAWAASLRKQLPVTVSVPATVPGGHKGGPIEIRLTLPDPKPANGDGHKCGCGGQGGAAAQGEGGDKNPAFEGLKPYPNEHACRLRDPKDFKPKSFRRVTRKSDGKTYSIIMGKLKDGDGSMVEQAYRYPKDEWTPAEAKKHCKDHDGGTFEPAGDNEDSFEAQEAEITAAITERGIELDPFRYLLGLTVDTIGYHQPEKAGQAALLRIGAKRGQRIAKRNLDLLEEADELLGKALEEKDIPRAARALIASAQGNIKRVVKDGKREGDDGEEGKSLETRAREIIAGLLAGKSLSGSTLFALFRMLEPLKAGAEAEVRRVAEERIMRELVTI
jgi:hypothetical protein